MMNKVILKRAKRSIISILLLFSLSGVSSAAVLDDFYQPFLKDNKMLFETRSDFFLLDEKGVTRGSGYDKFDSTPKLFSLDNILRFSPTKNSDFTLGHKNIFSSSYERFTYNVAHALASIQDYEVDNSQDYKFNMRLRKDPLEFYFDFLSRRQKANWNWKIPPGPIIYFTYMRLHYEDLKTGLRFISAETKDKKTTNLSRLMRSLLSKRQFNLEAEVEYQNGKLRRNSPYPTAGRFFNFYHTLEPEVTPKVRIRYGLSDNLELQSGVYYTFEHKYIYEDRTFYSNNTSLFREGTYKLDNNFYIPLALHYRAKDNVELKFSSDFQHRDQLLDVTHKHRDDAVSVFNPRILRYYNTQPSISLTYLHEAGKQIQDDEFSSLTKRMLRKNQFLQIFKYKLDVTHLDRDPQNGPQNIIDTHSVFLYPLDYFVVGTEYASFFTGNTSNSATDILPQNYHLLEYKLIYGLTDSLNAGLGAGYRSKSSLDHMTLHDLKSRYYKFKHYYYLDFLLDWRITKNRSISFRSHYVPEYRTTIDVEGFREDHEAENAYFDAAVIFKVLF